jgi:hypothetical protein
MRWLITGTTSQCLRRSGLLFVGFLLMLAAFVVAQSPINPHTDIYDFKNGLKLSSGSTITEAYALAEPVVFCGDLGNATTSYLGPGLVGLNGTPTDYVMAGTACNALDSTTEATADAPLSTLATKIMGFRCKVSTAPTGTNSHIFTLRSNAAVATPTEGAYTSLTGTATECHSQTGALAAIAANAPVAIAALSNYDASAADARCVAIVAFP